MTEHQLEVPRLDAKTVTAARLTVATHALDAADCADLLDMLGLRQEALCSECHEPMSRPAPDGRDHREGTGGVCSRCHSKLKRRKATRVCDYGHRIPADDKVCDVCREYLPIGELHMVIERIKRDTGWSTYKIAQEAGLRPPSLISALTPSKAQKSIRRYTYQAVLRVAEELSA
ncbi:hypothetical protein [Nocardia vaccinii]|uniref:hypothetical protein n=1 Tax=Nocardia vaccinii TaxID=1822 RepID=UPI001470B55C|nr:hypothetical protein [Nocardia vaccinii]